MKARNQYLKMLQKDYLGAAKLRKQELLNEAEARTGLARKYLIRKLAAKTRWDSKQRKPRAPVYDGRVKAALVELWDIFDQPCGQRLAPLLPENIPKLRAWGELAN